MRLTSHWACEKPCLVSPPPSLHLPTAAPLGHGWTLIPQETGKWGLKTKLRLEKGRKMHITMKICHRLYTMQRLTRARAGERVLLTDPLPTNPPGPGSQGGMATSSVSVKALVLQLCPSLWWGQGRPGKWLRRKSSPLPPEDSLTWTTSPAGRHWGGWGQQGSGCPPSACSCTPAVRSRWLRAAAPACPV